MLFIGILIGRYGIKNNEENESKQEEISSKLMAEISASNIGDYLKYTATVLKILHCNK